MDVAVAACHCRRRCCCPGPAGGVRAAAAVAAACGHPDAISFDMGGTSTDVCLVLGRRAGARRGTREVGGLPIRLPSLDVHTIGAGGGSIAGDRRRWRAARRARVGRARCPARPATAAAARRPTVTDADLVLGRIPADDGLRRAGSPRPRRRGRGAGRRGRRRARAWSTWSNAQHGAGAAVGVGRAWRRPRPAWRSSRSAAPARCTRATWPSAAGIPTVIVPGAAGVLSAVGLLTSPPRRELVRSWPTPSDHHGLRRERSLELAAVGDASCSARGPGRVEVTASTALDCRYAARATSCGSRAIDGLPGAHLRRNGYDARRRAGRGGGAARRRRGRRRRRRSSRSWHGGRTSRRRRCDGPAGRGARGLHDLGARGLGRATPGPLGRCVLTRDGAGVVTEPRPRRAAAC